MRALRRLRRFLLVACPARLALLASLRRSPFHAVESWTAPGEPGPEVALFIHFDAAGQVAAPVLRYLAALREAGLSVLFVSNAGHLEPPAWEALRGLCAGILVRRNIGYDFGAMREGLAHWRLPRADTRMVLLANDSVLGPFAPLRPVLDRIDFAEADVWGAVDTRQRRYHLQSWFLAAGRRALDDPAWARFWSRVRPVQSKAWVIGHYEVAFTAAMQGAGLRVRALWPYDELLRRVQGVQGFGSSAELRQFARVAKFLRRGHDLNPTADLWRTLLAAGCPFIKRELVGANPARVADAADARDLASRDRDGQRPAIAEIASSSQPMMSSSPPAGATPGSRIPPSASE